MYVVNTRYPFPMLSLDLSEVDSSSHFLLLPIFYRRCKWWCTVCGNFLETRNINQVVESTLQCNNFTNLIQVFRVLKIENNRIEEYWRNVQKWLTTKKFKNFFSNENTISRFFLFSIFCFVFYFQPTLSVYHSITLLFDFVKLIKHSSFAK